jgi:glycosyltransferase involved in cell wall biosynthesis
MNIVYIGAFRFPTYDAAAARVLNIGRSLRALGHHITYISWGGSSEAKNPRKLRVYDGFNYYVSGELNEKSKLKKIRNKLYSGTESLKILKNMLSQTDVVISYNPWFDFNLKLIHLCKKNDVKYIADITEWYDNNEIKIVDILPNKFNMVLINRYFVKNKIVISSYLSKYYSSTRNITIPATCNSVDAKWSVCRANRDSDFPIILIYAGNPAKKDKLHEIINAVEYVERRYSGKIQLNILGIDKQTYISRYSIYLSNPKMSDAIKFVGRIPQEDVPKYYAKADFMVLLRDPSLKSNAGFPTKFAESMMSGTPVIANVTSDLGVYLKDGINGFIIESPDMLSLASVLLDKVLTLNRASLDMLHNQAKDTGLKYFDFTCYNNQLNNFIKNLI